MTSLPRRLFWLAFWVVGFAVAMTGLLLYFKYQSVFTGLQRDRILLVAREIDEIERRRTAETFLKAIDVAGPDGRIAYASDMARMGSSLPPEWMPLVTKPAPLAAFSPSRDEAVVSSPIRNGFGQVAGYTVVRYGRELEHEAMAKFTREIVFACGVSWAGFTLLLFALLMAMRRGIEGVFGRAADAVDGTGPVPAALAQELGRAGERFAQAERLLHAAGSPR